MDVKKLPFVIEDRQRALSPRCTGVGRKRRASKEEIRQNPVLVSWTPKASRLVSTMKLRGNPNKSPFVCEVLHVPQQEGPF